MRKQGSEHKRSSFRSHAKHGNARPDASRPFLPTRKHPHDPRPLSNPRTDLPALPHQIVDFLKAARLKALLSQLKWEKAAHKADRTYQVWQEGSHPQQIQGEEMMWQKIEYIQNNPVARSYVDDPLHWRHSSARNYAGQAGQFPVCTDWR